MKKTSSKILKIEIPLEEGIFNGNEIKLCSSLYKKKFDDCTGYIEKCNIRVGMKNNSPKVVKLSK